MESESSELSNTSHGQTSDVPVASAMDSAQQNSGQDAPSKASVSGISNWAKNLKIPQSLVGSQNESPTESSGKSSFSRFTSGFGVRLSPKASQQGENSDGTQPAAQSGFIGTITKGIVDSSKSAVKAVQVKARHVVSQNKRRYQVACLCF